MNILNPEYGYIKKTTIQYAERRLVVRKLFNSKQRRRWGETPFVINRINIKKVLGIGSIKVNCLNALFLLTQSHLNLLKNRKPWAELVVFIF